MPLPLGPIQINSTHFMHVHLGAQRCECGGFYRIREHRHVRRGDSRIRQVIAICKQCRCPKVFEFDVTGVVETRDDRKRFVGTLTTFLDALSAIKHHDLRGAERKLLRVLDVERGEPNFTAAHYHLGRIAFKTGRTDEAVRRFSRASMLLPTDVAYREALCEAYQAVGNQDAALGQFAAIQDLKLKAAAWQESAPAFEE